MAISMEIESGHLLQVVATLTDISDATVRAGLGNGGTHPADVVSLMETLSTPHGTNLNHSDGQIQDLTGRKCRCGK